MVPKTEMLQMIKYASDYEERFLPELHELMEEKILEYRLSDEKTKEARTLLAILTEDSMRHFNLLMEAFKKVDGSDADEY